tara:strand:+ start:4130 stop:4882 length:753 start_codon:yes stop_codon:yes gene_type:complete
MISLLNFIDTGFIITLGLLLLISGAVMLYCYRRLNMLENSIIDHGKILQNFIMNYNNQVFTGRQNQDSDLNNSKVRYGSMNETNKDNHVEKIRVSDDEQSDGYTESENDSDTDSNSDGGENDHDNDTSYPTTNTIVELESEIISDDVKTKNLNINENLFNGIKILKDTSMADINIPITNNLQVDSVQLDLRHLVGKLPLHLDAPQSETGEKKKYIRQKVDELRSLVVTKNLTDNESAQQMKKNELLKLLE